MTIEGGTREEEMDRWPVATTGFLEFLPDLAFSPLPVPSSGKVKNGVPSRMRNDWMVYKRRRGTSSK